MNQYRVSDIDVVIADDLRRFESECKKLLDQGWHLSGEIQLAVDSEGRIMTYVQRMVKKVPM